MRRREFIAGLGGAAAGAAIGGAAVWIYAAGAHRALHLKILRLQADTAAEKIASFIGEGAIQSDAVTLRIFVMRVIGCHLRASRFWPRWPNRPPNRRFDG